MPTMQWNFLLAFGKKETQSNCEFSRKMVRKLYGQIFAEWKTIVSNAMCVHIRLRVSSSSSWLSIFALKHFFLSHRNSPKTMRRSSIFTIMYFVRFLFLCPVLLVIHLAYNWWWWIPPKIWQPAQVWSCEQSGSRQQQRYLLLVVRTHPKNFKEFWNLHFFFFFFVFCAWIFFGFCSEQAILNSFIKFYNDDDFALAANAAQISFKISLLIL